MHPSASVDKYPELERCESTATSTADTPQGSGPQGHFVASSPAPGKGAKPVRPSPSFHENSTTLLALLANVSELSENMKHLTTTVDALAIGQRQRTAPAIVRQGAPEPSRRLEDNHMDSDHNFHRGYSRVQGSRAPSEAQGRDDASNMGSTTEKTRHRRKWRKLSATESFAALDVKASDVGRQRSALFQYDQALGKISEHTASNSPALNVSPASGGGGGLPQQPKAMSEKVSEPSISSSRARNDIVLDFGNVMQAHADALGGQPTPAILSSPGRNPRPRKEQGNKQGMMEDEYLVVLCDIIYIIIATALTVVTISAVNPRIDILNTPGLFYTAIPLYVFSTVFTILWVVLRFFVQVRKGEWEIIDSGRDIGLRYLQTWFIFDLIYAVPIEYIFIGWNWDVYFLCQTRQFLRLLRLVFLGSSGNPLRETRSWFRFVSFIVAYGLIVHSVASGFGAIEHHDYLDSLYWTILTMATVGYGDVVPTTDGGKIYCIFAMLLGVSLMSILTAFATQYLTGKDKLRADIEDKKSMLNSMLQWYEVPWEVQRDVISMFPAVLDTQAEDAFRNLCEGMPKCVMIKIEQYAKVKLLRSVSFFKDFKNEEALFEMSKALTKRFVPNREFIVLAGEVGKEMFFIVRGVVEVIVPDPNDLDEEEVVATLRSGEYFGEIALVEHLQRTASVQAVTLCELWVLEKADLEEICAVHEDLRVTIKRIATNRINDMKERLAQQQMIGNGFHGLIPDEEEQAIGMGQSSGGNSFKLDPDGTNPLGVISPRSDERAARVSPSQDHFSTF